MCLKYDDLATYNFSSLPELTDIVLIEARIKSKNLFDIWQLTWIVKVRADKSEKQVQEVT